jgi:hypothetical protein
MPELLLAIVDSAVWSDQVNQYDERHFLTYARLLDAETANADWREVSRIVLLLDPGREPQRAHQCWQSHLACARWVATTGYQQLVDKAELRSDRD